MCGAAALAGVPLLSGFWSKDEILAVLYEASHMPGRTARTYFAIFVVAAFTALLTAFYTFRAYFMTFWGEERFPEEAGHHPHEAPPVMAWPLRILAVCARVHWCGRWADGLVRRTICITRAGLVEVARARLRMSG